MKLYTRLTLITVGNVLILMYFITFISAENKIVNIYTYVIAVWWRLSYNIIIIMYINILYSILTHYIIRKLTIKFLCTKINQHNLK